MQPVPFWLKGRGNRQIDFVPDYRADLFVAPQGTYQWLQARVQSWQQAQPKQPAADRVWKASHHGLQTVPGDQVLSLVAEQGMGRTWLLRHLAEGDEQVAPLAVYLDLDRRAASPTPEDYVASVEDQIRERRGLPGAAAVLLLDAVPPDLDDYLRLLEDVVLRPHLMQRGSLAIMALVHPSHVCWRAPALRAGERSCLLPFDEAQTGEQVRRLQEAGLAGHGVNAPALQEASGGLPLLNYLLATRDRMESFELLLEVWLSRVPSQERGRVQGTLEAVCILEALEQLQVQQMLDLVSLHRDGTVEPPAHAGEARNLLQKHVLAWASPDSPGRVVLAGGVRRAAQEVLKARDPDLFAILQRAV
jgi:hypothetical protein